MFLRAAVICLFFTTAATGQTVTDGDTLRLAGITYRLNGIDAPESAQTCAGWPAGKLATTALQGLISGRQVVCQEEGRDRYGRAIGKCYAAGIDLGGEMVRRGWAWAFRRYSVEYVPFEELARKEGLGVHGHPCELPWDWRRLPSDSDNGRRPALSK